MSILKSEPVFPFTEGNYAKPHHIIVSGSDEEIGVYTARNNDLWPLPVWSVILGKTPPESAYGAYQWDAIMSDGDMFKGGVGGQGLYVSPSRDMVAVWFTTGDGTEWNEAMGRAIALNFD